MSWLKRKYINSPGKLACNELPAGSSLQASFTVFTKVFVSYPKIFKLNHEMGINFACHLKTTIRAYLKVSIITIDYFFARECGM